MKSSLRDEIGRVLGSRVERASSVSGGDINEAFSVELADRRRAFVKYNAAAPPGMFAAEAGGLAWLAEPRVVAVPGVIAVGEGYLVLEWVDAGPRTPRFDEDLGRKLAALHASGAPGFGHVQDNFIGHLPQDNQSALDWPTFYRVRRLAPMVERARGLLGKSLVLAFERLYLRLPELVGPVEPAARLHGDMWGGNLHATADGEPCLVDPAVYGGHREMDLAMMKLFGGFGPRVFAAYQEACPLAPGHERRVDLYQLYPLLVHVNLFGASYVGAVGRALQSNL